MRANPEPPVALYVEAPTGALARAFASLLAADLATHKLPAVVLDAPTPAAAEGLAREKDLRSLLRVTLSADNSRLVARGDVLSTWVNFWAGSAPTRTAAAAALAATVDADLQAMTLASATSVPANPAASLQLALRVIARLSLPPAALAVADLNGDRRAEIIALTDDELRVLSADGATLAQYDLRSLPPASRPAREPFGAVTAQAGRISWLSGRRAHGGSVAFAAGALEPLGPTDELPLDGVTVRPVPGLNALAAEVGWFGKPLTLPAPLTTTSTRAGLSLFLFANGSGALSRGVPPTAVFWGASSAAVLTDLDGDGTPELLATSPRFFPDGDEVKVLQVSAVEAVAGHAGQLSEATAVWSGATPRGRVLACAAGDLDADGAEEVVLGVWLSDGTGELYVARRITP